MNRPTISLMPRHDNCEACRVAARPYIELSTPVTRIESLTDRLARALAAAQVYDRAVWAQDDPAEAERFARLEREALDEARRLSALIKSNLAFLGKEGK